MKLILILTLVFSLVFISCNKENETESSPKEFKITGQAQKGPFINGSNVQIFELDKKFNQTGKSFTTVTDEKGNFEISGLKLESSYVQIIADGFYFNEVSGNLSNEKITLKTLVDIENHENININLLTNLEFERVKYLIKNNELSLDSAKSKAQNEILKIFNLDSLQIEKPENLDIVKSGKADAALLAISAILQSNRSTSELSKLQADIITDMKEDGTLDNADLQTSIITNAAVLNLENVRKNLVSKYKEFGISLENINDYDVYVRKFLSGSKFIIKSPFEFPISTETGINILADTVTLISSEQESALAVKMPSTGKLMVKLRKKTGDGNWFYKLGHTNGWNVSDYNFTKNEQTFTSMQNNANLDMGLTFTGSGSMEVEFYYNDSQTPNISKVVSWKPINTFQFRNESPAGTNILSLKENSIIKSGENYTIGVFNYSKFDAYFKLLLSDGLTVEVTGGYGNYSTSSATNQLEFNLKGENSSSEIIVKFTGEGSITFQSNVLLNDSSNNKTYIIKI